MSWKRINVPLCVAGGLTLATFALGTANADEPKAEEAVAKARNEVYQSKIVPLLTKHCLDCHGPDVQEGELTLHQYKNAAAIAADGKVWAKVLEMIESRAMPPDDHAQPSEQERKDLVAWIDRVIYNVDCQSGTQPGRVTIRRLNRTEYNNTVRDLLGIDFRPADDFPSDDVGGGFDNIGDVLSLPPLLMEKYLLAAEQIAAKTILLNAEQATRSQRPARLQVEGSARREDSQYSISSAGGVWAEFDFPRAGAYIVRASAGATKAGDEPAKMELALSGGTKEVFAVREGPTEPKAYEFQTQVKAGKHRVSASFLNDFYDPDAKDRRRRDRNLYVSGLEVVGPLDIGINEYPEQHRKLLAVRPSKKVSALDAARQNLRPLINRAFRRKASDDEVDRFAQLVAHSVAQGDSFEQAMQVGLIGVLVSPHFLFRVERDPAADDPQSVRELTGFELASRLSYFLWSSMPDDELFALASVGQLQRTEVLDQQVRRMLKDPKADALTQNFAAQWLNLRLLEGVTPNPRVFGEFDEALKADMRRETEMFFAAVMRDDKSVLDFLDGKYTFVNERLAKHYGLDGVEGDEFRRVELGKTQRAGVLTQGSVLLLTSNAARTSPVKRGKWILDNLLGAPPPDPPPDVPELDSVQKAMPSATLRKQLEIHRESPACASCHETMDQLGFGLENFDAIGRWRERDGKHPIDATGILPGGETFDGPLELAQVLSGRRREFARCLTEKMLTFALGRELEPGDRCEVDEIVANLEANDYRFSRLVTAIVTSEPFRKRQREGATP